MVDAPNDAKASWQRLLSGKNLLVLSLAQLLVLAVAIFAGLLLVGSGTLCSMSFDFTSSSFVACEDTRSLLKKIQKNEQGLQHLAIWLSEGDEDQLQEVLITITQKKPEIVINSLVDSKIKLKPYEADLARLEMYWLDSEKLATDLEKEIEDLKNEYSFFEEDFSARLKKLREDKKLIRKLMEQSKARTGIFIDAGIGMHASVPAKSDEPGKCMVYVSPNSKLGNQMVLVTNRSGNEILAFARPGLTDRPELEYSMHVNSEQSELLGLRQGEDPIAARVIGETDARNIDSVCHRLIVNRYYNYVVAKKNRYYKK